MQLTGNGDGDEKEVTCTKDAGCKYRWGKKKRSRSKDLREKFKTAMELWLETFVEGQTGGHPLDTQEEEEKEDEEEPKDEENEKMSGISGSESEGERKG